MNMKFHLLCSGLCGLTHILATESVVATSNIQQKLLIRDVYGISPLRKSYDYVIVGAGAAGLTLGDRLSEDGKSTVLVVENGGMINSRLIDWVRDRGSWDVTSPTWIYHLLSAPNKEFQGSQFSEYPIAIGRMVGGSSAVNGMQVIRGTRNDYNRWGTFFGSNSSWNWDGMLHYFQKALHFQLPPEEVLDQMPGLKYDQSNWGTSSKLFAGWPSFQWPGIKYQFQAFGNVSGVEFPKDAGDGKTGVYWYPTYMDGVGSINRSYSRTAHWDGLRRPNYELITWSKVTKILLDGNKATGVVFQSSKNDTSLGVPVTIKANKEVIVSAGTIHSPQILQLSGIGPSKLLKSAGIKTVVDLPGVGQNFHDHNCLMYEIKYQNFSIYPNRRDNFTQPAFIAWANELWDANRTGPWSHALWNTGAWLPMPVVAPDTFETIARKVDVQKAADYLPAATDSTVIAGYQARLRAFAAAIRSREDVFYSHYFSGDEPVNYFTFEHPLSSGSVSINTTAPAAEPVVDYRTYSNPVDFDIMVALARFHRRVNEESPVLRQFAPLETAPGRNVTSMQDWIAYLRNNTIPTAEHPSGTCAMMPKELGGVVDEQLRVYGTRNLRVVDASVMSIVPGANIAGSVFAIAEKAADMIRYGAQAQGTFVY